MPALELILIAVVRCHNPPDDSIQMIGFRLG